MTLLAKELLHETLEEKATILMRNTIADHPFCDGNKRTALVAALAFLELNNKMFVAKVDELEDYAVKIAVDHLEIAEIAAWLKVHTK